MLGVGVIRDQAAQIGDALDPRGLSGLGEVGRGLQIAPAEAPAGCHGVHQVVGDGGTFECRRQGLGPTPSPECR